MKKNTMLKENLREIWKSRNRFLSIMAIIAIGTGFFAGVKASCPDMKLTAEHYFRDTNLMDLQLLSTFGFNEDDLAGIQRLNGIRDFQPAYSVDALVPGVENQAEMIMKALSYSPDYKVNKPVVKEGRMPEKSGECVVGKGLSVPPSWEIGSTISLISGAEDPLSDTLKTTEFTIVGFVESSLYLNFERGSSTIGDGKIDGFLMIPQEDFGLEVYTNVYLTLENTKGLDPFLTAYEDAIDLTTVDFEALAAIRAQERYDEIYDEAMVEINDAKAELADGKATLEKELADAQKELDDAEQKLADGKLEYENGKLTYEQEIADAEKKLDEGETELLKNEKVYLDGMEQYEQGRKDFEEQRPAAEEKIKEYEQQATVLLQQLTAARIQLEGGKTLVSGIDSVLTNFATQSAPAANIPAEVQAVIDGSAALSGMLPEDSRVDFPKLLTTYVTKEGASKTQARTALDGALKGVREGLVANEQQLTEGEVGLSQLQDGIADGKKQLADGEQKLQETKATLDAAKIKLEGGKRELADGRVTLTTERAKGLLELEKAAAEIADGEQKLADGRKEYEEGKAKGETEIADGEQKLLDAEAELSDLALPKWYVWDRDNNPGHASYQEDAEKVDAISAVFPIFFVLVAALVCLTTMTRMVEEQRTLIGTMKALGYSRYTIMKKYLSYAVSASILGCVLGLTVGFQLFPRVIIMAYRTMYVLPDALTPFRWDYAILCTVVALLCTGLSALAACHKELATSPAQLMRPKAPKSGKRVLMERIPFIWNRLSFSHKVTVRNLFRYKRRALMTIIGVAGCTALILTGFALRYAISAIGDKQFDTIFYYDGIVAVDDKATAAEKQALDTAISGISGIDGHISIYQKNFDVTNGKTVKSATLFVPQKPEELRQFIALQERFLKTPLELTDEGVIINEKLAKILKLSVGDTLTLNNPDGKPLPVTVLGVTENYVMNYVYMTEGLYREKFRAAPDYNAFFFNAREGADDSLISEEILKSEKVLGVALTKDSDKTFQDLIKSLDVIVWVLIISAGALAFVVMYNLVSINVNERVRELATIKVLGFYDNEVAAYIYRESTISATIGMLVGLLLGVVLEKFVVQTAEMDTVMFAPDIAPYCFLVSALITLLFILVVNIFIYFVLKKIDMVQSLKSVE